MDGEITLKPQVFTLGAQGPKGERLFFFQSIDSKSSAPLSLKCEKSQIVEMAKVLEFLLEDMPVKDNIPLEDLEPQEIDELALDWVVGALNIYYFWERDEIEFHLVKLEFPDELTELDETGQPAADIENRPNQNESQKESIKLIITREQADGVLRIARNLIETGRPLCNLCFAPLNDAPESNFCPCWN